MLSWRRPATPPVRTTVISVDVEGAVGRGGEACATALGDSIHLDSDHSLFYTATAELISRVVEIAERLAQAAPSAVDRTRHKLADAACAAYDIGADDRGFGHRRR